MKKLIVLIFNMLVTFLCHAQTDTAFWFAAPEVSTSHEQPIHLRMTSYLQPCTVTISQPAGGGLPTQTFSIAPNTTLSVDLSAWITSIECLPGNAIQNKGIKITSSNKISIYYEVNANGPSPELFVLKGRNALGNDFYISSQYILDNSLLHTPRPKSSFNIVATEDNTVVTITPTNNIVGHAANIPFVINLNKGQTYAAIAVSELAALHLQGSHVTSTKPIAITLSDDLLQGGPVYGGFCQDLTGDQTVPVNIIGNEYVAIKSNLNAPFDKVYITASQNATSVMQDGVFITSLNTGQSTELSVTNNSTYIQSSAPVYAYQLSGVGCEMGSTLLPKISCTGSSSVSVTRSTSESFFVTLLVRNGGQNSFLVNNVGGVITSAQFAVVPATGGLWYAAKVSLPLANYPNGSVITVSNSSNIFQLGVLQGGVLSGLAHGYFSDYNSLEAHASASATTVCVGSTIQLFADFIVSATYSWTGPNGFISNLQNPVIPNAAVVNSGMYHLTVDVPGCGTYLDSVIVTVDVCTVPCNNWLSTPSFSSYATIGDLDVSGDQITVEATFNRTEPLNSGFLPGFIISKHSNSTNVNYALSPSGCEITTTNGYKGTFESCGLGLNKTYHVAMVYNGSSLKFYRNGFLISQVAWTGTMILNNLPATIAQNAGAKTVNEQFMGYMNEVRIWNVARTQAQIQTYMNNSLPNPTSTPGLLGYYTFDNLLNKQGNAAFNATVVAPATINATNPNCTFIVDSCVVPVSCNNWLRTQAVGQSVTVGDLDVSGNQITVEANFNCSSFPPTRPDKQEDIVSKHSNTTDINYVLRMDLAGITTTNGQFLTPIPCDELVTNKTYHVAMVYNGSTLKFYRNGFLMSQVAAAGNLVLNNWLTTIGDYAVNNPVGTNFLGYINEVRIWNVARTQAQIQTYMDASLPNPTTQTGLQGYYTFDNLLNKQGNPAWNGTLNGGASINNTNPNCTFIADSCVALPVSCNNWLTTPTNPSRVIIGDLNVTGNQITVETNFNCTSYTTSGLGFGGKLIGKHTNAANTCYALSPHAAELSTANNGYVVTYDNCPFELNKTYHVAMVYDGTSLKFYRNGFLMSQIPCSGNISTNSLLASIGNGPNSPLITQFYGHINEMRIWNVARTQAQLQTYMNNSLPNPTTQSGLLAYYTFDNLLNKQGNPAWNGTLNGGATINNVNPNCSFVADSCAVTPATSIIINDYTPVLALGLCDNKITVEDGTRYNVGDTVLLIQMKGAIIDSTNTAAFGTITDYKNAGNYEFNYVKSRVGNIVELKNRLTRQYDIPFGKVQLIRVPYFTDITVTDTLTCLPWDGNKGGVLVFNVQNALTLNGNMDVSGKGFKGGLDPVSNPAVFNCNENQFYYPANPDLASGKGEGIANISAARSFGKGALANGGGGGNSHNSGGAGGGNISAGGFGGYQFEGSPCNVTVPFDNRGLGGKSLTYSNAANKIFLGGGGGAGHTNNPEALQAKGGNGGGIIIVAAGSLTSNTKKIIANGSDGAACGLTTSGCHEGMGGGGAAGSVLLKVTTYPDNTNIETRGGKGADMTAAGFGKVGPGGGGSGGVVWLSNASLPATVFTLNAGGVNGVCTGYANNPWGATSGAAGQNLFNLILPVDIVPFQKNIDSVRIKDSIIACLNVDFKGLAYTNTNPISTWQWYFGDAATANTQNTTHTYAAAGTYTVKLVVTDINGCKDSVSKPVTVNICNSVVINDYTPVLGFNPCDNKLTVENGSAYNVGDTVLLIQMKGAIIDSTNTAAFGTITDYKNAGNYEFNYVKSRVGNIVELKNRLTRQYDIPFGKVQLIRVPYFTDITVTDTLTCLPWDGNKGGVLVFNVLNTITLNQVIDVSGKGFKGAAGYNPGNATLTCSENNYNYPTNTILAARKGESITSISDNIICGKGSPAGGGGGGLGHNSGGGGGGNGGAGGFGGYQLEPCGNAPFNNRGIGGKNLNYSTAVNKVFMGSGGGAGHADNPGNIPPAGGNGAGIIIISADKIQSNTKKIVANGVNGLACSIPSSPDCHDAMGGGGSGGTILISINQFLDNSTIEAKGGKGADMVGSVPVGGRIGAGGGGGGGIAFLKSGTIPANLTITNTGGVNGVLTTDANNPWGATPGAAGQNLFNLVLPVDIVPFQKNIDSVRIRDSLLSCNGFDFKGLAYVNTNPIATWQWYFGDGGQANTQNTSHAYAAAGTYTVKLIVTDINGCKDSTSKDVNALPGVSANAGSDTSICSNGTVSVMLNGTAVGGPYLWSPAIYLNNPNIQNPTATISSTTTFYLNVTNGASCTAVDSVTIYINPLPLVDTRPDTAICQSATLVLSTNSNAATFQWNPPAYVSDPTIASPNFIGNSSGWVYVTGTTALGCAATDSLYVTVNPLPLVDTRPDTAICFSYPLVLNTNSNAVTFQWSPAAYVSNPTIASPAYIHTASAWVYVTGTSALGCPATDSLFVTVNAIPLVDTRADTAICRFSALVLNTNSNATTYQWSPAAYVSDPTIASPNYINNSSAWVYVTGTTALGCFAKDSLYVTVNPLPVVQTIADTILCQDINITLTTTGAQTYSWSPAIGLSDPNIASPVFSGNTGQTYTVTGTDINGCKNTDQVSIIVKTPALFNAPPSFTVCGQQTVQLDGNNGINVSYLWSPATYLSNATIRNPLANPPQTTLYTLVVTDNVCGFDSTFTTLLTIIPAPVVNARKSNDIDCAFRSATLTASGGNQYLWSPSTGLNDPTSANPIATPATTQTYTVLVTNGTGCTNTDTVTVFNKRAASLGRYMPNAFTPDGNGNNDCYGLKNWMYIQQLQFYIFNRYGEQVFGTSNPNTCWDGTYKGKPALAGTYVYVIKAQTSCGQEEQKGNFILIR